MGDLFIPVPSEAHRGVIFSLDTVVGVAGSAEAPGPTCSCLLDLALLGAQTTQGEKKTKPTTQQAMRHPITVPVISPSPWNPPSLFPVPRGAEAPPLPQLTGSAPVLHPVVAVEGEHPHVCQHVVNGRVHLRGGDVLGTPAGTWGLAWSHRDVPCSPGAPGERGCPGVEKRETLGEKGVLGWRKEQPLRKRKE